MPKTGARRETEPARLVVTPRQLEILRFIRDYRATNGYSPTMQEIAGQLGVNKVTVFEHVESLVRKGVLRRLPFKARSLILSEQVRFDDESATQIPLVGYIAAGAPVEAVQTPESIDLREMFAGRSGTFVLKVRGNSMIDEQIRDGDYVIVEKRQDVRDGETVVALLDDGEATLKKFYREKGGKVRLQPANPEFAPIHVDRVNVQGVVVGVIRKMQQ
jgi:repressor LexA